MADSVTFTIDGVSGGEGNSRSGATNTKGLTDLFLNEPTSDHVKKLRFVAHHKYPQHHRF